PLAATLSVPPDGAPRLIGSWVDATVTEDGALAGRVALPFTLLGQPADLTADLAGTLADPRVTAELTGAGVSAAARASPSAATAELTLAGGGRAGPAASPDGRGRRVPGPGGRPPSRRARRRAGGRGDRERRGRGPDRG